ncbi:hypothetical protein RHJ63_06545 [Thermosynechococcus sp. JY1334]|uniref:hypothetical protein n=1 Tax=unclassified Thermosynechococcus TaxID=2622553 RepID=UPI0026717A92|nr:MULTISPECIES: hypothetical protein [unclassified Thermosynechococcus]MDR5638871.1 hypothetical protein [Thermosynechococcus sp. PP42]MDR7897968.1 hypothetical protein [Thermosynechococcus sp. JY1332]MDR7905368.1 hypothetical protein [Thermosynechococcus sp. JY1334]MDR7993192.1 hypothetical protein [Thermosynechococcus sp. TG252]WKT85104.1 hypothetical protein QYC30_06515 [Thermosynechococcus sp. JY1339]
MTPKPTLWQKLFPLLLREAIAMLQGINNLLSKATEQLKGVATQRAIAPEQLTPERSWVSRGAALWWQGMGWVQQRLPNHLQERYNRATLTGIAIALLLILLWLNPLSWFQSPPRPTVKATQRPQPSVLVQPRPAPTPMAATPAPTPQPTPTPTPSPGAIAPSTFVSDSLTVRQQLLALCDRYSNALDPTLTLTPSEQRLELMLANSWYDLSPTKQDQLAQNLWQTAHDLGYQTVIVVDTEGHLLVRDPVVGDNAIVVRRKLI